MTQDANFDVKFVEGRVFGGFRYEIFAIDGAKPYWSGTIHWSNGEVTYCRDDIGVDHLRLTMMNIGNRGL